MSGLVRLAPSAVLKEKRLAALLEGRDGAELRLREAVADAQLLGSLDLAGFAFTWEEVQAARRGAASPEPLRRLRRAQEAVDPEAPFSLAALSAWHEAATGAARGFRKTPPRERAEAAPGSPPEFVESRLALLEQWINADSGRELKPAPLAALVLARIVEILPFEDANGRVSRLAASHLMVRGGLRPPILAGGDAPRLVRCLQAAFQLHTEPLTALLEEASERSLDVMIQTASARI